MLRMVILFFVLLLTPKMALGETITLNLEKAIELGIKQNEEIKKAKSGVSAADAAVDEAYSLVFPKLDVKASQNRYYMAPIAPIGGMDVRLKKNWETDYGITVKQLLWAFGRVSDGIDIAKSYERLSNINVDKAENDLTKDISKIYFATLLSKNSVEIQKQSLQNAKDNKSILVKRFQSGRIPVYDSIKMDSDIASRVPGLEQTKKEYNERLNTLKFLLGVKLDDELILSDSLDDVRKKIVPNREMAREQAHKSNPSLKALSQMSDIAHKNVNLERKTNYPTLSGFASYGQNANHDNYVFEEDLNTNLVAGLALNINIYDGGQARAKARKAKAEAMQKDLDVSQFKRNINTQLGTLYSNLESLEITLKAQKKDIKLAKKTFDLTRRRYAAGTSTQKDLNDAELRLSVAKMRHEGTLFQLAETKLNIDYYTAKK